MAVMNRRLLLTPLLLVAGLLSACDGDGVRITTSTSDSGDKGVLKVVDALQCPESEGVLTRKGSAAPGGDICTYGGARGAEVTLHLVRLDGETPDAALAAFEQRLSASMPDAANQASANGDARVRIRANDEDASVDLPGLKIRAEGDAADIRIGGLRINASDGGNAGSSTQVSTGGDQVDVQASGDMAVVRTSEGGDSTRATFLLTDDQPSPEGWRMVGFQARGPNGGPIVVATVRSKDRLSDELMDAARRLVTLNVGR